MRRSSRRRIVGWVAAIVGGLVALGLSGCGSIMANSAVAGGGLSVNPTSVSFGSVTVGQTASVTVTLSNGGTDSVQVSDFTVSGQGFKVANGDALPLTLNAGDSYNLTVQFAPTAAGSASGQVTVTSTAASAGTLSVGLSGTGTAATKDPVSVLDSLSCSHSSMTGSGSDNCTVTLSGAAPSGGVSVSLSSNSNAVKVPASVTIAENETSAAFVAKVAAVTAAQTGKLTASANGVNKSFDVQLNAADRVLSVDATTVAFGNVTVNAKATQSVTLSSTGTIAVTVSGATATGSGFKLSGATFPLTLSPGQTVTLNVTFTPAAAGAATGQLAIASDSTGAATTAVKLTGTGVSVSSTTYSVDLSWDAPGSSSDPVAGYHVYRAAGTSANFQLLTSSVHVPLTYTDAGVQSGQTYTYMVTSVDASGVESAGSNLFKATIP